MDVSATLMLALPYYLMTVAAWGTAVMCVVAVRIRIRPPWVLLLGGACLLLGAAMFLMAATAAPGGHTTRSSVAAVIRVLHASAGVLWLAWLAAFVRGAVVVTRHK